MLTSRPVRMQRRATRSGPIPATVASRPALRPAADADDLARSVETRRAARPRRREPVRAPASPRTIAAVAAVLASTHVAATTDAVRHGDSTGAPVRGSMRWCRARLAAPPAPDGRARRRDRAGPDRDDLAGSVGRRLAVLRDEDSPAACGRRARDGDVAAERDEDAAAARRVQRATRRRGPRRGALPTEPRSISTPRAVWTRRRSAASATVCQRRARPRNGPRAALRPGAGSGSRGRSRSGASPARPSGRRRRS